MIEVLIIISLSIFSIISVFNFFTAPVLQKSLNINPQDKLVSILIPVRNEEKNIEKCINGVLIQSYNNKEIIILDDCSTDNTFKIASSIKHDNLKVVKGEQLPEGWIGKNWACHQLSQSANGSFLLFIDADVILKPESVSSAVYEIENTNSSLLSVFPTQIIKSLGEHLIVPLMNWLLLTFLPLKLVHTSKQEALVAANGQFMLWDRDSYFFVGGHKNVKNKIVEDMELARLCKLNGLKILTLLGGNLIFCRMYSSFKESYNGFTKNFYPGFRINPFAFLVFILFLFLVFNSPFINFVYSINIVIIIILLFLIRISVAIKSKQSLILTALLHPFQMLLMIWIAINSVVKFHTKNLEWKQRKI